MGNLRTRSILLATEVTHQRHVVQTELTGPVELQLVVQVALGGPVVHLAALGAPLVAHGVVEAVVSLVGLLVEYGTRFRVYPLQLWVVIQVGNTAAVLTEHVIPRNHTAQRQTLGDEVQLLLQYEISVDAGGGNGLYTTDRRSLCRVRHIGRIGEVTPRAITVLWQEGIRRNVVDTSPHL